MFSWCFGWNAARPINLRREATSSSIGLRGLQVYSKSLRQYKKQFGMFASIKDSVRVASSRRTLYCVTDGEKLLHTGWISTRCRHYWIDNDAFVIGPIWTSKEARGRKIAQYALKRAVNSVLQESANGVFFIDTSLDNIPCLKVIDRCGSIDRLAPMSAEFMPIASLITARVPRRDSQAVGQGEMAAQEAPQFAIPIRNGIPISLIALIRGALRLATWSIFVAAIIQWILIRWLGDVWWLGTVALFAPRWPLLVPLAIVAGLSLVFCHKLLRIQLACLVLITMLVMGFSIPQPYRPPGNGAFRIRILTANIGHASVEKLRRVIQEESPDVIALQEYRRVPIEQLAGSGWYCDAGSGVIVLSRYPILQSEVMTGDRVSRWGRVAVRSQLATPAGNIWVCSQHLNTPRHGFEELTVTRRGVTGIEAVNMVIDQRDRQSKSIRQWLDGLTEPTIVAGDFNMPTESYFYRRDWSSLQDAYLITGFGYGNTWFSSWHGVRIDRVLADDHWRIVDCHVAASTDGDHRPVVADLTLQPI